jgi:hypothetical protein
MATLIRSDLEFILQQILIAEQHAAGADLASLLPNQLAMLGLRTVDGSYNNIVPGQQFSVQPISHFDGAIFPAALHLGPVIDLFTISNLIVDQTITNPAAVQPSSMAVSGILVGDVPFLNEDGTAELRSCRRR